jgi:nitroreductase
MESKVFEAIRSRFSVRDYDPRPIEKEKLDLILESARLAPSASNSQPWHFYVVKNKEKIAALGGKMPLGSESMINGFLAEAPVVVVATAGPIDLFHKVMGAIVNKKWYLVDVGIAVEHMALTAWDLGIGSCWIGWFDEQRVKKTLGIKDKEEVIALLTLGYPGKEIGPRPKVRKAMDEIVKVIP